MEADHYEGAEPMETTPTAELLTVAEVCALTRLSKSSVLREIDAGEFEASRLGPRGGAIRVTRESVIDYKARRVIKPVAA
jgi:excisionase family DNA binding protein